MGDTSYNICCIRFTLKKLNIWKVQVVNAALRPDFG
jgi:hypothetical protein